MNFFTAFKLIYSIHYYNIIYNGDWGLGIGPNPQSPIPNKLNYIKLNRLIVILINDHFI